MLRRLSTAACVAMSCISLAFPISAAANIVNTANLTVIQDPSFLDEVPTYQMPNNLVPGEIWVRIDLQKRELVVYRDVEIVTVIPRVSIGANGASWVRRQGSKVTPLGEFRIERINTESQFHRFFGIDYPTLDVADRAFAQGIIGTEEYKFIHDYRAKHGHAPAHTSLGGYIGIHGLGRRDQTLHAILDWTLGCLATTNLEIEQLSNWLDIGTRVRIDV